MIASSKVNIASETPYYNGVCSLFRVSKWHVNGKVTSVTRTAGSIKPDLEFQYDAMGNRTVKIVKPRTINGASDESKWEYSYYVRDASGNVMAIYSKKYTSFGNSGYTEKYTLLEQDIYGSSRLGTYTPVDNVIASRDVYGTIDATTKKINISNVYNLSNKTKDADNLALYTGHKSYELSNHLGNVLAVVSDRKFATGGGTEIADEKFDVANNTGGFAENGSTVVMNNDAKTQALYFHIDKIYNGVVRNLPTVPGESYQVEFDFEMNPNYPNIQGCGFAVKDANETTLNQSWTNQDGTGFGLVFRATGTTSKFYVYTGNPDGTQGEYWIKNFKVTSVAHYEAEILMSADYQAYGGAIEDRQFASESYRYGFNGKEKESGLSNDIYDFGARIYNPQIARFLSTDPKEKEYPFMSPYVYAVNNPIRWMDVNGEGPGDGEVRLYVTRVKIGLDKSNQPVYKYFGKKYYRNLTNDNANKHKAYGVDGWFKVSVTDYIKVRGKEEYSNESNPNVVHAHTKSATAENDMAIYKHIDGADDYEKPLGTLAHIPNGIGDGNLLNKVTSLKPSETKADYTMEDVQDIPLLTNGTIKITNNEATPKLISIAIVDDATGLSTTAFTTTLEPGGVAYYDFNYDPSTQSFELNNSSAEGYGNVIIGVVTKEKKSDERAPDTWDNYGTEEPSTDVVEKLLEQ